MIKKLLFSCFIIFTFFKLTAQPYGNEWINYSQKYYKIKVVQNGIYKINHSTLLNAGIPINGIDPRNIQIFNNGVEQAIYVEGESDGIFNTGDFIEFYGKKNDGKLDSLVYTYTNFVPNPYYSLYNDTAVYFLTWNSSISNKRLTVESDVNFTGYTPSNYFLKEEIRDFHSRYFAGETNIIASTDCRYTKSEGWFDSNILTLNGNIQYNGLLNTSNVYPSGPNATIKTVVLGASKNDALIKNGKDDHRIQIEYKGSSGSYNIFVDSAFKGYESNRFSFSVNASALGNTFTDFRYSSLPINNVLSNNTAISYIYIKYPHTFDLENKTLFELYLPDASAQAKAFLNISNFSANGTVRFYDLSNSKRINVVQNGSNFDLLVPNSGGEKKCFITSDNNMTIVTSITPVTANAQFTNYSLLNVDSAYVIISHKSLMTEANNYKIYRSTGFYGGNHNVIIADIDELYDHFAFGIAKNPLAIRRFCDYLSDTYTSPPQNLFLLGKSIHMRDCRQNNANYNSCLVPSFGNPSSDNLLTSMLNNNNIAPGIPTGRLAAKNTSDVALYLNKIQQFENRTTNPPDKWMKHVLHFGGGANIGEQTTFKNYLNLYKGIIQDTNYGGIVIKEFFKTSSAPIQINVSDTLEDLINEGVSLMTFFGHASGSGFDQSIDDVNNYNPIPGHYPFVLANSCYSGDFHTAGAGSTSEKFMLVNNKGMIGFLASVGLGIPYALNSFSKEFYTQVGKTNYDKSISSSVKNTIFSLNSNAQNDTLIRAVCYEMNLHGDPALKLNTHPLPDYKIANSDVFFDLTTQTDSFTVYAARTNIGMATGDSIFTELIRTFPNGDKEIYLLRNKAPKYSDTVSFKLPVDFARGIGLNKIKVTLDRNLEVAELNENNNTTNPEVDLLITGGDILPVYPYEFAIIPTDTITLKASTANPLAPAKNYLFQLDTTDTFNSPFLKTTIKNSIGGVVTWKPNVQFNDSMVYYWRVSPDSIDTTGYKWRESSFQYILNKKGWGQAHFFQYKNDDYEYVKFNRPQRRFDFVNDVRQIRCINGIVPYIGWDKVVYQINGADQFVSAYSYPGQGMVFALIDPISGKPMENIPQGGGQGLYGSITSATYKEYAFDFRVNDSLQQTKVKDFINNNIPNGYHVLAYSIQQQNAAQYISDLKTAFQTLGSNGLQTTPANVPLIFWGRKGNTPGQSTVVTGTNIADDIQLDTSITTSWNEGYIASPVIGPASSWGSLHWRKKAIDGATTKDTAYLRLIGIKANGAEDIIINFPEDSMDILNLASYVDANIYPNIRMQVFMRDDSLKTPPQMRRWQVIYSPVPEAALNPPLGYSISKDTLQEGDSITLHMPIQNIGDINFNDSLLVTYWIEDANNVKHTMPSKLKKSPFIPGQVIMDTVIVKSIGYPGQNTFWMEVNPINQPKSQLEQHHFNNIIRIPFVVDDDKINPIMDVTFDGVHILNNDIVSSLPNVLVQLKDENKFLALNDTTDFKVYILKPNASVAERVYFKPDVMTFIPAQLPNNSCKINYTPYFDIDGTYQLIIQAKDKSDNLSGAIDYKINFKVVNKVTITEVMNYPNPFSTSTRFVFTLTGYKVPTDFKIQIMTITGKVVREIFLDELGPIHVGRNITEYAWDGKDQFGDQLANGVYLYRVITRMDGEEIEKMQTEADQYFKKGWGKMYLMR